MYRCTLVAVKRLSPAARDPRSTAEVPAGLRVGVRENRRSDGCSRRALMGDRHPQVTLLLVSSGDSSPGSAPLAGLGVSTQVEKGDDGGSKGPAAAAPPSGQGQILVGAGPVTSLQTGSLGLYLINGSSCTPPVNGDTSLPGVPLIFNSAASHSAFAIFPTAPGTHRVSVVAWTSDVAPTCAQ